MTFFCLVWTHPNPTLRILTLKSLLRTTFLPTPIEINLPKQFSYILLNFRMEKFVCKIDKFGTSELVAILLKLSDTGCDLKFWVKIYLWSVLILMKFEFKKKRFLFSTHVKKQLKISRGGIKCPNFIQFANTHRNWFLSQYQYTLENLEKAYRMKICRILISHGKRLNFHDEPVWGSNVVYIMSINRSGRDDSFLYYRLQPTKIMWVKHKFFVI